MKNIYTMFRLPSTDEYKRHVLVTVKTRIDGSPKITVNKLKMEMVNTFFFKEDDVENAISILRNVFHCIKTYKVPGTNANHINPVASQSWDNFVNQTETA